MSGSLDLMNHTLNNLLISSLIARTQAQAHSFTSLQYTYECVCAFNGQFMSHKSVVSKFICRLLFAYCSKTFQLLRQHTHKNNKNTDENVRVLMSKREKEKVCKSLLTENDIIRLFLKCSSSNNFHLVVLCTFLTSFYLRIWEINRFPF